MHTLIASHDGAFRTGLPLTGICDLLADARSTLWLDLQSPDEAEIAVLRDQFGFHPLAIEDAIRAHERPKVDAYDSYYFLVFYAAAYDAAADHVLLAAMNIFVGANYLVTVHDRPIPQINETFTRWQAPNSPLGNKVSALVYALLDALVDAYFPVLDQIADHVEDMEDAIFIHFSEQTIETIFALKKDLIALRRTVAPARDVMNVLLRREVPIFRSKDMIYLQDVYDHLVRVTDTIDTYRDLLSNALDSYLSLQSNQLNQVMKILTLGSILLMSASLVAGIYGMNFVFMPELRQPWGYPAALALMAVISAALIVVFRRRRWW
jgi:magnesium transporter